MQTSVQTALERAPGCRGGAAAGRVRAVSQVRVEILEEHVENVNAPCLCKVLLECGVAGVVTDSAAECCCYFCLADPLVNCGQHCVEVFVVFALA